MYLSLWVHLLPADTNIVTEEALSFFGADLKPPTGFPLKLSLTIFSNWAHDIVKCSVWTAYPENGNEVVAAANWAMFNKYDLHASGNMHNWSPLTLADSEHHPTLFSCGIGNETIVQQLFPHQPARVILLKTSALNKIEVSSTRPEDSFFWSEPGVLMEHVLQKLEGRNLGLLSFPAPGNMTIGGVLAVGGHGTGVPATGETLSKGHSFGSLSNLIISFTAVVYNKSLGKYTLKEFTRSEPEAKALLINLGRTFVTNFTLRAGPLQYLRCRSYIDIPASKLFAASEGANSISRMLNMYGRLEVILFPFTTHPWLKVWSVEPVKPRLSREVISPYNYPFTNSIPESVSLVIKAMMEHHLYNFTRLIGKTQYACTVAGLVATSSFDIWGSSKNTLLYVKTSTLRYHENGYAVVTDRASVQRVVHEIYVFFNSLLLSYEARDLYPINGPIEIRITGLDTPEDVLIEGAVGAALSSVQLVDGSNFDTAVWVALSTYIKSPSCGSFLQEFEEFLFRTFNGQRAVTRVEWSKGWALTSDGPWTNKRFFDEQVKNSLPLANYKYSMDTMEEYDPYFVFTNDFTREYFITWNLRSLTQKPNIVKMNMISFRKHGSVTLADNDEQEEGEAFALQEYPPEIDLGESQRKKRCLQKSDFQVNSVFVSNAIVVVVVGLSMLLTRYMDARVPEPVSARNASNATIRFSEERARRDLEHLTSVGVRVSGSEAADVTTVQNILKALSTITESGRSKFFNLEYTIQRPTGSFFVDKNAGFTSVYAGISNVVAKLEPKDGTNDSVLVNCHFDTKPGTPGASDNMISCVTMLEVIRTLYHYQSNDVAGVLKNSIVFLFNGDEEMYLQGSHGFIRGDEGGHPWAQNIRCFINLEAAGSGGREVLFQSGPGNGWILKSYAKSAPHPYTTVFAEELFQAGLIPSDTDFRIFRDFKNIPGLDMAFVKNGYVYHTKWDRAVDIPPGSIQNMGDNVLAIVQDLGNLDLQAVDHSGTRMVFFDVLGLFVVSYSEIIGISINLLVALIFIGLVLLE
ncbi:unnamed protein product, partial [Allacma fusca]